VHVREFSRHVGGGVEALDFLEFLASVKTCENDKKRLLFGDFWHPHFFSVSNQPSLISLRPTSTVKLGGAQ